MAVEEARRELIKNIGSAEEGGVDDDKLLAQAVSEIVRLRRVISENNSASCAVRRSFPTPIISQRVSSSSYSHQRRIPHQLGKPR